MSDAQLRAEQDRLLAEGHRLHSEAMQVIPLAEKQPIPKDIQKSIYEFKRLMAQADITYDAARNLKQYEGMIRKIPPQMRAIAEQVLGLRADTMRSQTENMDRLVVQVQNECVRAIKLADGYQGKAEAARREYERKKAAYHAENRHSDFSYDDHLWLRAEEAEENANFDWEQLAMSNGDWQPGDWGHSDGY